MFTNEQKQTLTQSPTLSEWCEENKVSLITPKVLKSENNFRFFVVTLETGEERSVFFSKKLNEKYDKLEKSNNQFVISTRELGNYKVIKANYDDERSSSIRYKLFDASNLDSVHIAEDSDFFDD